MRLVCREQGIDIPRQGGFHHRHMLAVDIPVAAIHPGDNTVAPVLVVVWSKNPCGLQMVVFQQPAQAFVSGD